MQSRELGPENGALQVRTYREGMASRAGHDLVIDVTAWRATVVTGLDSVPAGVELTADPRSLRVRDGSGGAKALTDRDRGEIAKNIDEKVLGGRAIEFRSTAIERPGGNGRLGVAGELSIAGVTRPVRFDLTLGPDGEVQGTVQVRQSEWGVKPYTALMGALKVRDEVEVVLDARL